MVDSTQLERLNVAKARALVEKTFPNQDFEVEVKNSAVLISNQETIFVYAKNEKISAWKFFGASNWKLRGNPKQKFLHFIEL